jgi:hypothetical protein
MTKTAKQIAMPPKPDPRALNSVKHGVLSDLVPDWEREAYTAHALAVRESVGAGTYLQQRLADRAALALWRLDRVARWETRQIETDSRRWSDRARSPEPSLSFPGLTPARVDARDLRGTLEALAELSAESQGAFLTDPAIAERCAADFDRAAQGWAVLLEAGDLGTLAAETVEWLGSELIGQLQGVWDVSSKRLTRVLLGRRATQQEAQDVADWEWTVEPQQLPALVAEGARAGGAGWREWLSEKRFTVTGKARMVRSLAARLPVLIEQEWAQAAEPDARRLEKIARYEAHLERVLYRALHELAATTAADPPTPQPGELPGALTSMN